MPPKKKHRTETFDDKPKVNVNPVDESITDRIPSLKCPICVFVMLDPVETKCGHLFCEQCLECWFSVEKSCPECRGSLKGSRTKNVYNFKVHNRLAYELMFGELRVQCPFSEAKYCNWTGSYDNIRTHTQDSCGGYLLSCRHCSIQKPRCNLIEHESNCEQRTVQCEYCHRDMKAQLIVSHHNNDCSVAPIVCTYKSCDGKSNGCGQKVPRNQFDSHRLNCTKRIISCPLSSIGCKHYGEADSINDHLKDTQLHLPLITNEIRDIKHQLQTVNGMQSQQIDTQAINNLIDAASQSIKANQSEIASLRSELKEIKIIHASTMMQVNILTKRFNTNEEKLNEISTVLELQSRIFPVFKSNVNCSVSSQSLSGLIHEMSNFSGMESLSSMHDDASLTSVTCSSFDFVSSSRVLFHSCAPINVEPPLECFIFSNAAPIKFTFHSAACAQVLPLPGSPINPIALGIGCSAVQHGDYIYVSGGDCPASSIVHRYDINNKTWSLCPPLLAARRRHVSVPISNPDRIIVCGGCSGSVDFLDSEVLDLINMKWTHLESPHFKHPAAVTMKNKIFVFENGTAWMFDGSNRWIDTLHQLNLWTSLSSPTFKRTGGKAVVVNGNIWYMGGRMNHSFLPVSTIEQYNACVDKFTMMPWTLPSPMESFDVVFHHTTQTLMIVLDNDVYIRKLPFESHEWQKLNANFTETVSSSLLSSLVPNHH